MAKDTHLINIYLKIHNKQNLTMDDLRYLAQYAPECFEKTCKNVVYNFPEAKPIMEPSVQEPSTATTLPSDTSYANPQASEQPAEQPQELSEQQKIEKILENLKRLETNELPFANIEANDVKSLLGNLYMELLFPHNDKDTFFNVASNEVISSFDAKI